MLPMLFSSQSVIGSKSATGLRMRHLDCQFGGLLNVELPPVAELLDDFAELTDERLAEWRRCVAEELLLRRACGIHNPKDWLAEFAGVSPFGADHPVKLDDCLGHHSACGVFPLAGNRQDDQPGIGHAWVFSGLKHRENINGGNVIPDELGFCFVATDTWQGRSWQLAGMLACRCLTIDNPADVIRNIARHWMVTGRVGRRGIAVPVNLGNKLALTTERSWLLPLDNLSDVPPSSSALTIRTAVDLNAAWSHITGIGTRADTEQLWPKRLNELHILIGGDIKAGVASALFCPPETQVQIWHSDSQKFSILPMQTLQLVVAELRPDLEIIEPQRLDSANLVSAEKKLREVFDNLQSGCRVLFNITSGNRLMSYAVQNAARIHPNVQLVYRDVDANHFEFTCLDHSQLPPVSRILRGTHRPEINWDWLFSRTPPSSSSTPETLADDFLRQVRKINPVGS